MIAPALVALALFAAACGGSDEGTPLGAGGAATLEETTPQQGRPAGERGNGTASRGTRRRSGASGDCAERGITQPPYNEGTCVERGTRFVIANGQSTMRMRTLSAELQGFIVSEGIQDAKPRQGAFVVILLRVRNRTSSPVRFAASQTSLTIGEERYEERTDVEAKTDQALASPARRAIAPGRSAEGTVIFDISTSEIDRITREGELLLVNFDGNPPGKLPEFGQFRIYIR